MALCAVHTAQTRRAAWTKWTEGPKSSVRVAVPMGLCSSKQRVVEEEDVAARAAPVNKPEEILKGTVESAIDKLEVIAKTDLDNDGDIADVPIVSEAPQEAATAEYPVETEPVDAPLEVESGPRQDYIVPKSERSSSGSVKDMASRFEAKAKEEYSSRRLSGASSAADEEKGATEVRTEAPPPSPVQDVLGSTVLGATLSYLGGLLSPREEAPAAEEEPAAEIPDGAVEGAINKLEETTKIDLDGDGQVGAADIAETVPATPQKVDYDSEASHETSPASTTTGLAALVPAADGLVGSEPEAQPTFYEKVTAYLSPRKEATYDGPAEAEAPATPAAPAAEDERHSFSGLLCKSVSTLRCTPGRASTASVEADSDALHRINASVAQLGLATGVSAQPAHNASTSEQIKTISDRIAAIESDLGISGDVAQ